MAIRGAAATTRCVLYTLYVYVYNCCIYVRAKCETCSVLHIATRHVVAVVGRRTGTN